MANEIISRADAKAQGLKRYFTGNPCPHGHVAERIVSESKCVVCLSKAATIRARRWALNNPEKRKQTTQRWRKENPEVYRASCRLTKEANKNKYAETYRKDHRSNPEKYRERVRRYYYENRTVRLQYSAIAGRKRKARKLGNGGSHTAADLLAILKSQNGKCGYCRKSLSKRKKHVDHIIPLSCGGSNDRTNIQYLCAPCNLTKGAKDPILFAQELGRLL